MTRQPASTETEEDTAPGVAALVGMIVIGLLYAAFSQNVIVGPNWLLLALEAVFLAPLLISIAMKRGLSHDAKRRLLLLPLGEDALQKSACIRWHVTSTCFTSRS